ncbi:hypothetical protein C7M84_001507 [Penaeus vannamei]|uniref:Uncharacterized protein n=1 Tax=Penaeus vannamei TaxID=6689 RepID=A0A3R7MEQ3_PENVA|nr:hypothetical protein C7M84_001507 [Penaeus vannamei]
MPLMTHHNASDPATKLVRSLLSDERIRPRIYMPVKEKRPEELGRRIRSNMGKLTLLSLASLVVLSAAGGGGGGGGYGGGGSGGTSSHSFSLGGGGGGGGYGGGGFGGGGGGGGGHAEAGLWRWRWRRRLRRVWRFLE